MNSVFLLLGGTVTGWLGVPGLCLVLRVEIVT